MSPNISYMKKITLIFLAVLCQSLAAQTTAIPDENFESFLEANGMGNGIDEDHLVTTANISTITTLDLITSADIESLTGIEDFTALITLNCSSSNITTLDLSALSNLESLNCEKTDLILLDLTSNTSLKELYASETDLTELDLSQNSALTILEAHSNPNLTSLNVKNGNNTNVTYIVTVDSPNLFCVVVDDPVYSEENWNYFSGMLFSDVDCALTAIPDNSFLEKLQIIPELAYSFNETSVLTHKVAALTTLNISGSSVSNLTGIEDFVGLQELTCINTSITNIDITQSTALTKLNVANNLLVDLDVTQNILLTELYCYSNALTTLEVSQNNLLEIFDCSSNQLTRLNLKNGNNGALNTSHLVENPNLTCIKVDDPITSNLNTTWLKDAQSNYELNCGETYVPDANFEQALIDLGYDTGALDNYVPTANINRLTNLDVSSKSIGNLTGIEDFEALTTLKANYNSFATIDVSNLSQLVTLWAFSGSLTNLDVTTNTLLEDLRVENNQLDEINLTNNPLLRILQINNNNLEAIDVTNNTGLTRIRIHYNPITELDLSNNVALEEIRAFQSQLTVLNIKNGNNDIITVFNATGNSNLTCILVDNASATILNSWNKDTQSFYSTDCRQTEVPDANFENYLETHNAAGTEVAIGDASSMGNGVDNDGYVTTEKIENVTSLNVPSKSIVELIGIEDFTALEDLQCYKNSLEDLDISKNTELITLNCSTNSLMNLDVTNNTKLTHLSCYVNSIGNLDVTQNSLLIDLYCNNNEIKSLDLSVNTDLEYLYCSGNKLSSINVTQNIILEELDCHDNVLISLDISKNTGLGYLECDENQLTSLDVSKNIGLNYVYCTDNLLSSLNLKNGNAVNTRLKATGNSDLYCIQVDDVFGSFRSSSKDAQAYYSTDCRQTEVPDDNFETYLETHDADGVAVAIGDANSMGNGVDNDGYVTTEKIETVISLGVVRNNISELTGIADFTALEILSCGSNSLDELDVSQNTQLTKLNCQDNQIGNLDITQNTALIELSCHTNALDNLDVTKNIALTILDCSSNQIEDLDITQNTLLTELECDANQIANLDVSQNIALTYFDCKNNQIISLDLTQNIVLNEFYCYENALTSLNLKNGNNLNLPDMDAYGNPNLSCILVDDVSASVLNSWGKDDTASFNDVSCGLLLSPKVFLQGAFFNPNTGEETLMRDDLRVGGYLSTNSPYNLDSIDATVLEVTGENAIVDWVSIGFRDLNDNTLLISDISGLLQRDGDIVDLDGISPLNHRLDVGTYHVSIKHRNHLEIVTAATVSLSDRITSIDFTMDSTVTLGGTNAVVNTGNGIFAILGGDYDTNGQVQNSDTSSVILELGTSGYSKADMDMNGQVQNSDINNILNPNIGKGQQF